MRKSKKEQTKKTKNYTKKIIKKTKDHTKTKSNQNIKKTNTKARTSHTSHTSRIPRFRPLLVPTNSLLLAVTVVTGNTLRTAGSTGSTVVTSTALA